MSLLALVLSTPLASGQQLSVAEITVRVLESANQYARAIACDAVESHPSDIAALVLYGEQSGGNMPGTYAVLWRGDIGCSGGEGSVINGITIVKRGAYDTFLVDSGLSTPNIKVNIPVVYIDRIVGNTERTLILEGMAIGGGEVHCCDIRKRFTLKQADNGDWDVVSERQIPIQNGHT